MLFSKNKIGALILLLLPAQLYASDPNLQGERPKPLSKAPLLIKQNVQSNILFTIDDSGSMRRGFVDALLQGSGQGAIRTQTKRFHFSSAGNDIYFDPDPDVVYELPYKNDGTRYSTSWPNAFVNGYLPDANGDGVNDTINLATDYRPVWHYPHPREQRLAQEYAHHPAEPEFPNRETATAAYYYEFSSTCSKSTQIFDESCYSLKRVTAEQQQKFAIWYSFYRTRWLATQTSLNLALFKRDEESTNFRFGWQGLKSCHLSDSDSRRKCYANGTLLDNLIQPYSADHRNKLMDWMKWIITEQDTPTREAYMRAGEWFKNTTSKGPYAIYDENGNASAPTSNGASSCRANFQVLLTDGAYTNNGEQTYHDATRLHNVDNQGQTLGDGTSYTPRAPYASSENKTLSDIAFYYWATDLTADLNNNVTPRERTSAGKWDPRNDPATWQHLTTYTMGLGMNAFLDPGDYVNDTFGGFAAEVIAGNKDWPLYVSTDNGAGNKFKKEKLYDLWHAAINSRGRFYSISKPESMVQAFKKIIDTSSNGTLSNSQAGFSGPTLGTADFAFSAIFDSRTWSGDVIASSITGAKIFPGEDGASSILSAAALLQDVEAKDRKIFIASSSEESKLQAFSWSNLNSEQQQAFSKAPNGASDALGPDRVAWLLGERPEMLRERISKIGDITFASPLHVGAPDSFGITGGIGSIGVEINEAASYMAFATQQEVRSRKEMLYVTTNDGILHGFDVSASRNEQDTPVPSANFLQEVFAFIPSALLEKIPALSDPDYSHDYYLDSTPVSQDVFINGKWRTVLIGGMRGARSIYALDITDPDNISLLWEITADNSSATDQLLGHTYIKPTIARLNDGKWYALLPNGYASPNIEGAFTGHAALLIVEIESGNVLALDTAIGSKTNPNGLGEIALADINGDLVVDYAYAGDLYGNLWRFDFVKPFPEKEKRFKLNGTTPSKDDWKIGFSGKPLFSAQYEGKAQPITSRPYISKHYLESGYVISFGTGRYIFEQDDVPTSINSVYGIWDWQADGYHSTNENVTVNRSDPSSSSLYKHSIQSQTIQTFSDNEFTIRTSSSGSPTWMDGDRRIQRGWYLDLTYTDQDNNTSQPEMVVTEGAVRGDLLIFQTTQIKDSTCQTPDVSRWLYGINPIDGSRVVFPQFDLNDNDSLDNGDQLDIKGGYKSVSAIKVSQVSMPRILGDYIYFSTAQGEVLKMKYGTGFRRNGRQNWRRAF